MSLDYINIDQLIVKNEQMFDIAKNIEYNKKIIQFYKRLLFNSRYVSDYNYRTKAKEFEKFDAKSIDWNGTYKEKVLTLENKIANMNNCNSLWLLDVYDIQKRKVLMKTNLCKDRFCNNCKKVKQATRMQRFIPEIQKYNSYDLYHLTLTVPNVSGYDLRYMVDVMKNAFRRLIEYFKGKEKISGIDFKKYNYLGALRSLEVTFKKSDSFHPHYHVLLALDYKDSDKVHVNSFSRRFGVIKDKFSDFEILIQKLWFLLIQQEKTKMKYSLEIDYINNNSKLTEKKKIKKVNEIEKQMKSDIKKMSIKKDNITNLKEGYSCKVVLFEEDQYYELFKYMTKAKNEDEEVFTYQNFLHLYFELKGVRQIQGYGCFFRLKDDDITDHVDITFQTIESILQLTELPRKSTEKTKDLAFEKGYKLISKNNLFNLINKIEQKEKEGCEPSLKNG